MNYLITDLFDIEKIESLIDEYCLLNNFAAALIDIQSSSTTPASPKKYCTHFHRKCFKSCRQCFRYNSILSNHSNDDQDFLLSKCEQGMYRAEVPVSIKGKHIADLIISQFLTMPPDFVFLKKQAAVNSIDEDKFLKAVKKDVPVISEKMIKKHILFLRDTIEMIGELSFGKLKLQKTKQKNSVSDNTNSKIIHTVDHETYNHFLHCLDQVNQVIQQTRDIEQMLWEAVKTTFSIFECDRAWLLYPCNPEESYYTVPVEVYRLEYSGANELNLKIPMKPGADEVCRAVLDAKEPVSFGPEGDLLLYKEVTEQFGVQSQLIMDIHPKTGDAWMFGMHQCSSPRIWTTDERRLFAEIGRRISDALSMRLFDQKLRKSEERMTLILQGADLGTWDWNIKTGEMSWNERWVKILGYTVDDLNPDRQLFLNRIHSADIEAVEKAINSHISGKINFYEAEYRIRHKSGSWIWVLDKGQVISRDMDGNPQRACGTYLNITERKIAEAELIDSQNMLEAILQNMPGLFIVLDEDGRYVKWNKASEELTGYSSEELQGMDCTYFFNIKNRKLLKEKIRTVFEEGSAEFEMEAEGEDGRQIPYYFVGAKRELKGKPFLVGQAIDITKRKATEEALKKSQELFIRAFNSSPNYMLISTVDEGRILQVNEAFIRGSGYCMEDLKTKTIIDLGMYDNPSDRGIIIDTLKKEGRISNLELNTRTKSGEKRILLLGAILIDDLSGKYLLVSANDITERKQFEIELIKSNRSYRALSDCNETIIRAKEYTETSKEVCRIITHECGYPLVWVGIAENDRNKTIRPIAESGDKKGYLNKIKVSWGSNKWSTGPSGEAIRTKRAVINKDSHNNPQYEPWKKEAINYGYISSASFPMLNTDNEVIGVLNVYAEEEDAFSNEEINLLSKLAENLAYGIETLKMRKNKEKIETAMRESESRYKSLFEDSPIPLLEEDFSEVKIYMDNIHKQGKTDLPSYLRNHPEAVNHCAGLVRLLDVNKATLALFETGSKKELKICLQELLPKKSMDVFRDELIALYDGSRNYKSDIVNKTLTGKDKLVTLYLTVAPGHQKTWGKVLISLLDITASRQAEDELDNLRNYLSNIINSMPSALVGVDSKGIVTQWNKEAQRITGINLETAMGCPITESFPRLGIDMKQIRESMLSKKVYTNRVQASNRDGEVRYEDVTVYPLLVEDKEGAVIRIDDITETVRMQELVIQSEKMLSIGGLAAGMAHEINNPLAGMLQTADVVSHRLLNLNLEANQHAAQKTGITPESIKKYMEFRKIPRMLNSINEAGQRISTIIDNMLSFARKSDAVYSGYDLAEILDKTLELAATDYNLKKHYDFKTINIIKEYESDIPTVICEEAKIQQVILNILRNGAEAMHDEVPEYSNPDMQKKNIKPQFIMRLVYEKETKSARMEIEDNGPGMDETTRKHIFDPFFTTKPIGIGTGLGLSVSYFIITETHQGQLNVISEPGAGTTFIIHLPVQENK